MTWKEAQRLVSGTRLIMSERGRAVYPRAIGTAAFLSMARDSVSVRIQRDGVKQIEIMPASYWDRAT